MLVFIQLDIRRLVQKVGDNSRRYAPVLRVDHGRIPYISDISPLYADIS